ncbi:sugar-binding transcriptional regulator [Aurantimonas sp. C2-6-R+9]|uniref:sugar-binding transcriptional regulator n=1 Tax=unclassified Aurantimonas TaxID=2638230 RepID=UPI002E1849CB|nr:MULTISPECIES: sugar-binding transcriptional regulator [unclassified Aurantimonas]MEC5291684.1 sugar-binding transcriptional regulator [Aurantimonas sp. C2-3-R2]MEC5323561.1 sugar-binding transcriptional regulator [Aurantimonas sp. A3-2-R12]MEC5381866.1 sugar-binding transcriptional regulator [Aurantimonas sp. C2-6-R+9]MEC5412768.1 sugar-binding transcriptional regulator [Aurantimonas sp. C2-4-R8]
MARTRDDDGSRLDDAARAGWLYYVAGNTQEEIAAKLGISRQAAQRLVSLSISAGLVRVRIDHPIAACLELAAALRARYGFGLVEVVPSDPASGSTTLGIAEACAAEMERRLRGEKPLVVAMGTGRTLKAAVENLPAMTCRQHRIVSLTGNVAPDGSASVYNVIFSMADRVRAPHYPMPLPVVVSSPEERALLHGQTVVQSTLSLAAGASVAFVGIGELDREAPLVVDGFITPQDRQSLIADGGIGEIVGWVFDAEGRILDCPFNARVASAPIPSTTHCEVIGVAMGPAKAAAIRAAADGKLVNGLITDEATARRLLDS